MRSRLRASREKGKKNKKEGKEKKEKKRENSEQSGVNKVGTKKKFTERFISSRRV